MVYRILLFYIGSLVVLLALYPWVEVKSNSSPFVMIFHNLDSNVVASALNFVILVASLSVYNSGVYSNSRMLFGLSVGERAEVLNPRQPSRRTGEFTDPLRCYYVSGRTDQLCPATKAFSLLMALVVATLLLNWIMICPPICDSGRRCVVRDVTRSSKRCCTRQELPVYCFPWHDSGADVYDGRYAPVSYPPAGVDPVPVRCLQTAVS